MRAQLERLRRAIWTYRQPLTHMPSWQNATVSDLFLWRNSDDWRTFFELTDIHSLFSDTNLNAGRAVILCCFDEEGRLLVNTEISLAQHRRKTVALTEYLSDFGKTHGTFCIFHSNTPPELSELGSFIAERGYVSYQYKNAPLRSYVHGNLDAATLSVDQNMQLLGGTSFLSREYRLQYDLKGPSTYEAFIVNPCSSGQRITCDVVAIRGNELLRRERLFIRSGGCRYINVALEESTPARLVIKSKLVMARPLVFGILNERLNVFHG